MNSALRTILLAALALVAGWWTLFLRDKLGENEAALAQRDHKIEELAEGVVLRDGQIRELEVDVEELGVALEQSEEHVQELQAALDLLKVDHRLATLRVLEQGPSEADPELVETRILFTELDANGEPIGEGREMTVEGSLVYVETLVIKFEDRFVEQGDALRGTSICLFKRVFGENQSPSAGTPIDAVGAQPLVYSGDDPPNPFQRTLWERFWDYANDPDAAREQGVRAIHGEAPFIEMRPGKTYRLELRSSGGLTIQAE